MPNIKEIALHAGVSVATVSRSLSQPHVVHPDTIKKVRAAVDLLGYRPNGIASSLRRARSENVIVVVPEINNPFFAGVVQGIEATARDAGYRLLLGETRNENRRVERYFEMVMTKAADGLILLVGQLPKSMKIGPAFPLVMACEYMPAMKAPVVRIDNAGAGREVAAHLVELGHRRLAHISGPEGNILSEERHAGFRDGLAGTGLRLPANAVVAGDFSVEGGYAAMHRLLGRSRPPTAVFCGSDEMAIGALRACAERGLRVPDDVSLVGFDDTRYARFAATPLTTIAQPHEEIGRTAMGLLADQLAHKPIGAVDRVLPHRLVVRSSSGPPRD